MASISGSQKKLGIALSLPLVLILLVAAVWLFPTASNQGYAPEQPIPFSHKLHAGDNKIPCLYCHSGAEKSRHATIPSMNVCMNCHSVVKTDSPLIQQVRKAYAEGKPIQWIRVHELPGAGA
ncbi:MAG: cytochrome c3 family protein, partial [Bdellovibrionota bacterium]